MPATSQQKVHEGADKTSETPDNGTQGRGRGRQLPPELKAQREAEKRARFLKVAQRRTRTAMKALDSLANTANKNTYSYTDREVEQILNVITERYNDLVGAFRHTQKDSEPEFTL